MSQVIRISTNLYKRLSLHAKGFETPANVIENILNYYEEHNNLELTATPFSVASSPTNLEIVFYPSGEDSFKKQLIQTKKAYIQLHNIDGTKEFKEWNANSINYSSSITGNLRSGYLRGWKEKGIFKAEVSIDLSNLKR